MHFIQWQQRFGLHKKSFLAISLSCTLSLLPISDVIYHCRFFCYPLRRFIYSLSSHLLLRWLLRRHAINSIFRIHLKFFSPCKLCSASYSDGHTGLSSFCNLHRFYHSTTTKVWLQIVDVFVVVVSVNSVSKTDILNIYILEHTT